MGENGVMDQKGGPEDKEVVTKIGMNIGNGGAEKIIMLSEDEIDVKVYGFFG